MISTMTAEEREQIIALYNSGLGASSIAKQIGRSETFVKYNLKKNGIKIRSVKAGEYRKYALNQNYFDVLDSEEKAYWLGFLYADGYNNELRGELKLCLSKDDAHHIQKFQAAIGSNYPLKENACNKRDNTIQIVICNRHFSAALSKLGCIQDKSLVLQFPKLEEKYLIPFMLGYFDGDGCICAVSCQFSITSSYDFITGCQEKLMQYCELNKTKLYDRWKGTHGATLRSHAWTLRYSGRNSIRRIYSFLYSGNVTCYLERKKVKFEQIVASPEEATGSTEEQTVVAVEPANEIQMLESNING